MKEMLWSRCLSKGGNRVASDLLLGLYSVDELYDVFGHSKMEVKRDEDGTILEIIDETITTPEIKITEKKESTE